MSLYLGIDGGGTKTKVNIIDENKKLIFENITGPSSIDTVSHDETYSSILDALNPYIKKVATLHFDSVFIGLGGIVSEDDELLVKDILLKIPGIDNKTKIMAKNDMENALYSGLTFDYGITLICGTGMVAFGKNKHMQHKCGGWGYKEGELGSSFHLGTEAIQYAVRAFDSRLKSTDFTDMLLTTLNIKHKEDIITSINSLYDQRTLIAGLAPIVTKYANLGDTYAKEICDHATDECALAIHGVYKYLGLKEATITIVGSLGNAPGYFRNQLQEKIRLISKDLIIQSPIVDPCYAAALKALTL